MHTSTLRHIFSHSLFSWRKKIYFPHIHTHTEFGFHINHNLKNKVMTLTTPPLWFTFLSLSASHAEVQIREACHCSLLIMLFFPHDSDFHLKLSSVLPERWQAQYYEGYCKAQNFIEKGANGRFYIGTLYRTWLIHVLDVFYCNFGKMNFKRNKV